jgi:PAS domain S-box-containing protein
MASIELMISTNKAKIVHPSSCHVRVPPMKNTFEVDRLGLFVTQVTDYAIYMLSPEGIVSSWNAGAERFKGYKPEEIIGHHFSCFYTAEDQANGMPAKALNTALTAGKFEDEGWRVRKDGTLFRASIVLDPIFGPNKELIGFTKITRDITQQYRAREELHASEERFRLLVQSVTDYAIYMLSPTGFITNWNEGAKRIKRLTFDQVEGTHFSRFYTDEDRATNLPERAIRVAREEGRFEHEGWRVRGDGTKFWAHVVIDPVHTSNGELIGFAKITRDVTERREAHLALDRTKEALHQAQKLEAIGKLTGGIAHDFNNLLNVVISGIDLLRSTVSPNQQRKIIDGMERAAQRGSALTSQLLAFARQQPLELQSHDLNRVISTFEAVLRRAIPSSAKFKITKSPTARVLTDISQFESALLNLVINARDALGDHGNIWVETRQMAVAKGELDDMPAGDYVVVTVGDDGSGMTPEVQARAMEPFFTTKAVGKGTGLGLSQVYGLMQQTGGYLRIESSIDAGTRISMFFAAQPASNIVALSEDNPMDKVLVVDDQPDVLEMAVAIFASLGYDPLSANSGTEALTLLRQNTDIKVLFSDVVMPGMDGVALANAARALMPDLKIVLASGYMSGSLRERFGDALESFDLIAKPYRLPDLVKRLAMS